MTKLNKKFAILFLILLSVFAFSFAACNKSGNSGESVVPQKNVQTLTLSKEKITLEKLESEYLTADVPASAKNSVLWRSMKAEVASVDNGKITALSAGVAVIIAEYDGKEGRCMVTVEDNGKIPDITTNVVNDVLYLIQGDTFDVVSAFTYNNKFLDDVSVNIRLDCNDGSVRLENRKITAQSNGVASVVLSATWEGFSVEKIIEVEVVDNIAVTLDSTNSIVIYNDLRGGEKYHALSPEVYFNDKLLNNDEYSISWDYDANIIALDESSNIVSGLRKGSTQLKATVTTLEGSVSVVSNLLVSVELYNDDKSNDIAIDELYLDEDGYYLLMNEIYADKQAGDLIGVEIKAVTDVTTGMSFDIPFTKVVDASGTDFVVDVNAVNELGLTGDRKWQIECDSFSYIVTVPFKANNPAKPLVGIYDTETWGYNVVIKYEKNKEKIAFISKVTDMVVEEGTYSLAPWAGNTDNGSIRILTNGNVISGTHTYDGKNFNDKYGDFNIRGYYYEIGGSYRMSFALSGGDTYNQHFYKDVNVSYSDLAGEFTNTSWAGNISLNENGTCTFNLNGTVNGIYAITATAPFKGNIVLAFENAVFGTQSVIEGVYTYSKLGAKMTLSVNAYGELSLSTGSDLYEEYSGYYKPIGSWQIPMRFLPDGTCIFDYVNWTNYASIGTYTLNDGVLTISVEKDYAGLKGYNGTYEIRDGVRCMVFVIRHAGEESKIFRQQG